MTSFPQLSEAQRAKWEQRLGQRADRTDRGQEYPLTAQALGLPDAVARLKALVQAFRLEKVIVPINVEQHPDADGEHHHIDPSSDDAPQLNVVAVGNKPAVAVYSSVSQLSAADPKARPMRVDFRKVALASLVESAGRVVVNPHRQGVLIPRPATAALAQGDVWLPAWEDRELLGELRDVVEGFDDPRVRGVEVFPEADGCSVRVEVTFTPGHYEESDRLWVGQVLSAVGASPRLQASAAAVVLLPRLA